MEGIECGVFSSIIAKLRLVASDCGCQMAASVAMYTNKFRDSYIPAAMTPVTVRLIAVLFAAMVITNLSCDVF